MPSNCSQMFKSFSSLFSEFHNYWNILSYFILLPVLRAVPLAGVHCVPPLCLIFPPQGSGWCGPLSSSWAAAASAITAEPSTAFRPSSGNMKSTWSLTGKPTITQRCHFISVRTPKATQPHPREPRTHRLWAAGVCFLGQHRAGSRKCGNKGVLTLSLEEPVPWLQLLEATGPCQIHTGWGLTRSLLWQIFFGPGSLMVFGISELRFRVQ